MRNKTELDRIQIRNLQDTIRHAKTANNDFVDMSVSVLEHILNSYLDKDFDNWLIRVEKENLRSMLDCAKRKLKDMEDENAKRT